MQRMKLILFLVYLNSRLCAITPLFIRYYLHCHHFHRLVCPIFHSCQQYDFQHLPLQHTSSNSGNKVSLIPTLERYALHLDPWKDLPQDLLKYSLVEFYPYATSYWKVRLYFHYGQRSICVCRNDLQGLHEEGSHFFQKRAIPEL
jgi:hypothetical protein